MKLLYFAFFVILAMTISCHADVLSAGADDKIITLPEITITEDMVSKEGVVKRICPIGSLHKNKSAFIDLQNDRETVRIVIKRTTKIFDLSGKPISLQDIKIGKSMKVFYRPSRLTSQIAKRVKCFFKHDAVTTKTFDGKIERILPVVSGKDNKSSLIIVKNPYRRIKIMVNSDTKLYDSSWNTLSLEALENGKNVQLKYFEGRKDVKTVESIRQL